MKIASWNVNGIRSAVSKGAVDAFIEKYDPDILCLQEVRADEATTKKVLGVGLAARYPYVYVHESRVKKGYSGTAILSKKEAVRDITSDHHGIGVAHDEGRITALEFDKFVVVSVYTPNSGQKLARLDYRVDEWDVQFCEYMKRLKEVYDNDGKKAVVVAGDLNVAHTEIDIYNASRNVKNAGFTPRERVSFNRILEETGFVDAFRAKHPGVVKYTFWSNFGQARKKNSGWRIDYTLVHSNKKTFVAEALILDEVMGSDHCPIMLECRP